MNPPRARAFGSLRSRNVRLFLGGQSVSLVGTWIQQVAMGWLAYRLTGSPLLLGDRKSTRLNSSHLVISYAVFCLKKKHHKSRISFRMLSLGQTLETQIGDSNKHERERNRNRPPVVTRLRYTQPDYDGPLYQRPQHTHIEH